MLTVYDVERGDRVVVTLSDRDGETETHEGEVARTGKRRIRIDVDGRLTKRIQIGLDGDGRPGGAELVEGSRELHRSVEDLEFDG